MNKYLPKTLRVKTNRSDSWLDQNIDINVELVTSQQIHMLRILWQVYVECKAVTMDNRDIRNCEDVCISELPQIGFRTEIGC